MKFKKLEVNKESNWLKITIQARHTRKTIIFMVIGAIAGFLYFYFTEGIHMDTIASGDILKSAIIGGFFGFFITNSPCARNKC